MHQCNLMQIYGRKKKKMEGSAEAGEVHPEEQRNALSTPTVGNDVSQSS